RNIKNLRFRFLSSLLNTVLPQARLLFPLNQLMICKPNGKLNQTLAKVLFGNNIFNKLMKLFKYLSITSLMILTLYSCTKHEGASIEGTTLNITLSGVESDYENLEPSLKSAKLEVNNKENNPVFQTQVIPLSKYIVLRK